MAKRVDDFLKEVSNKSNFEYLQGLLDIRPRYAKSTGKDRPYQTDAKNAVFSEWKNCTSTVIQLATGLGKTRIAKNIITQRLNPQKNKKALFIAHNIDLLHQFRSEFDENDLSFCPSFLDELHPTSRVNMVTIQEMIIRRKSNPAAYFRFIKQFDVAVFDEAHRYPDIDTAWGQVTRDIGDLGTFCVGLTATDYRMDNEDLLGETSYRYTIEDGVHDGWLVEVFGLAVSTHVVPDKEGWDNKELKLKFSNAKQRERARVIQNTLVETQEAWERKEPIQTILFVPRVAEAHALKKNMDKMGGLGNIAVIDGSPDLKDKRKQIYQDFKDNKINLIINVNVLIEGVNLPNAEIVALARSTRSKGLYEQMLGRGVRPDYYGPKNKLLVIDFVDNISAHYMKDIITSSSLRDEDIVFGSGRVYTKKSRKPVGDIAHIYKSEIELYTSRDWYHYEGAKELMHLFGFKNWKEFQSFCKDGFDTSHLGPEVEAKIKAIYDKMGMSEYYEV